MSNYRWPPVQNSVFRSREFGSGYLNGYQSGKCYGSAASSPGTSYMLSSLKPSAIQSYSNSGSASHCSDIYALRKTRASSIFDQNYGSGRSTADRISLTNSNAGTDYTSSLSSFSSGRYPNGSLSSRDSGSINDCNLSKSSSSYRKYLGNNLSSSIKEEEIKYTNDSVINKYIIVTSRATSTEDDTNVKSRLTGISTTKTEKSEVKMPRPINISNSTQTGDDIILPPTKLNTPLSNSEKTNSTRRINIGGRYLRQLSSNEEEPKSPKSGTGKWRESVYGMDYSNKMRAQTQPPCSPPQTPNSMSANEQRRYEREKMLAEDYEMQIQLEIERENRRLRQLERKAKWEKDKLKNMELEEEIKRRKQITAELMARSENNSKDQQLSSMNRKYEQTVSQDPIQKVNEWQRQNSLQDVDPPLTGEMNNSQLWEIPTKVTETSAVQLRPQSRLCSTKSELTRYSRDSEATIRPDNAISVTNTTNLHDRRRSSAMSASYVSQMTDIDEVLKDSTTAKSHTSSIKDSIATRLLKRDYYADGSGDSDQDDDRKMVFKSWKAKERFQKMPVDLQNLLLKSHVRLITFPMLMEICHNKNYDRKFTDLEEKTFRGYRNIDELLVESGMDVKKLEDSALQLYKFGQSQSEFGSYLDLDSTLQEQWEDLEICADQENGIVLRTKLVVRVKAIIEKLLNSTGRELKRALFSLKQIFQDDKDLVHEFVSNSGLDSLVSVGSRSDQNIQNFILRALGQIMLYVDGMAGVIEHSNILRWLYSLLTSKFRLVVKTALKLQLLFVDYAEMNAVILIKAVEAYHSNTPSSGRCWSHLTNILNNESSDSELLIYTMTLLNKTLNSIPDQDTFYDVTDCLEESGMQKIVQHHLNRKNCETELAEQFHLYEANLRYEDGEEFDDMQLPVGSCENLRQTRRLSRVEFLKTAEGEALMSSLNTGSKNIYMTEKSDGEISRKSKRYQSSDNLVQMNEIPSSRTNHLFGRKSIDVIPEKSLNDTQRGKYSSDINGSIEDVGDIKGKSVIVPEGPTIGSLKNKIEALSKASQKQYTESTNTNQVSTVTSSGGRTIQILKDMHGAQPEKVEEMKSQAPRERTGKILSVKEKFEAGLASKPPSSPSTNLNKKSDNASSLSGNLMAETETNVDAFWRRCEERVKQKPLRLNDLDFTDLTHDESDEEKMRTEKSHSSTTNGLPPPPPALSSPKVPGMPPPPPPPVPPTAPPAPSSTLSDGISDSGSIPPPPTSIPLPPAPPMMFGGPPKANASEPMPDLPPAPGSQLAKTKKTIRLHWTEWKPTVQDLKVVAASKPPDEPDNSSSGIGSRFLSRLEKKSKPLKDKTKEIKTARVWGELVNIKLDPGFLEETFENRSADVKMKKHETVVKKIEVLDMKRSNAINIGLKVLPPTRTINPAIMKMDTSVINREGIEKLLTTMLPTSEELEAIMKAKAEQEGLPLGHAEQFLVTLSSISHLKPRLELWLFRLDYDATEKEISEPLCDLKQALREVVNCKTLKYVFSVLLSIGNFLNGSTARGFNMDYLCRLPEVKDTKSKNSLLHHVCGIVLDQFPDSSDLHSELGSLCRCHRVDWEELPRRLEKLKIDSKKAWEHYRLIFGTEKESNKNAKLSEFISQAMERIICLQIVYSRINALFRHTLYYFGYSNTKVQNTSIGYFCRILAEFALEFRTTREKIIEGREKKALARERKRTRGKFIINVDGLNGMPVDMIQSKDEAELRDLLLRPNNETDSDTSSFTASIRRRINTPAPASKRITNRGRSPGLIAENSDASLEALDQEQDLLLDACLRASTPSLNSRRVLKDRKRPADRSRYSARRTLNRRLAEEDLQAIEFALKTVAKS